MIFFFQLPDIPDERMLLIFELNRSGKIETSVHNQYLQACEREKQALLEGDSNLLQKTLALAT